MSYLSRRLLVAIPAAIAAYICLQLTAASGLEGASRMVVDIIVLAVAAFVAAAFGTPSSPRPADSRPAGSQSAGARPTSRGADDTEREGGIVKWFNVKKGYGFIVRDQGDDVFVHYRNIVGQGRRSIAEGQRVTFCVVDGDQGPQADQVETD